jgi:uncharacterized iron-regulated membrane protein
MENKENSFQYTYSAKEQAEVDAIRKKYLPKEENKMERLRKLDRGATQKAQTNALSLGVIGTLILGTGMSLFMSDLGTMLSLSENAAMLIGIAAGLIGMVLVALAYPVYNRVLKKERARLAPEILRLTDELMK